jgi:hypothetical protein
MSYLHVIYWGKGGIPHLKGYFLIFSNQRLIYWYLQVLIIYIYVQNIK